MVGWGWVVLLTLEIAGYSQYLHCDLPGKGVLSGDNGTICVLFKYNIAPLFGIIIILLRSKMVKLFIESNYKVLNRTREREAQQPTPPCRA